MDYDIDGGKQGATADDLFPQRRIRYRNGLPWHARDRLQHALDQAR